MTQIPVPLLPNGLIDLLPPQADQESHSIQAMMVRFATFGYQRIKPPLVEFEESLLSEGPGKALSRQTFRLMDPVSQRMMGVRADVTAQIARIAMTRLQGEPRPLRLSYAADVLRVNGTQLRPERQLCQVGCELIGDDGIDADVEAPLIALCALNDLGVADLSVDLCVPTLMAHVYDETNETPEAKAIIDDLIEKRDSGALKRKATTAALIAHDLLLCEGTLDSAYRCLSALKLPPRAQDDLRRLLAVAKNLRAAMDVYGLNDVPITLDPLERRGFEYQTGISYTFFSRRAKGELGRGGRYGVNNTGETANGFTVYMDSVLSVVPALPPQKTQIFDNADWARMKAAQDQGIYAIRTNKTS